MTSRSLLFTALFIVSISAFAQQKTEESKPVKTTHNVTAIILETDDIEELRKFNWNEMLEMLSENTNDDKEFKFTLTPMKKRRMNLATIILNLVFLANRKMPKNYLKTPRKS